MPRILVVDDEINIVELIKFNLTKEKWVVETAFDGCSAIDFAVENKPDVIVLDVMLPGIDGLEVCRRLKSYHETESIPIIMLSAKAEEFDKVIGLEIGADDYMIKPFSPRELIARIKARLRKKVQVTTDKVQIEKINVGNINMNLLNYQVYVNGIKQNFTLKEFELLRLFLTNIGRVYTRDYLLDTIWGYGYSEDTRTVDVHIRHLRQKIENDPGNPVFIETVRGVGYRFIEGNNSITDS